MQTLGGVKRVALPIAGSPPCHFNTRSWRTFAQSEVTAADAMVCAHRPCFVYSNSKRLHRYLEPVANDQPGWLLPGAVLHAEAHCLLAVAYKWIPRTRLEFAEGFLAA